MAKIGTDIDEASKILVSGEVIGMPTETVYGLAGNALDVDTLLKIFEVKNRPKFDPLIAHVDSIEKVKAYITHLPAQVLTLANKFWPGPMTLLLDKKPNVPDLLTAGLQKMAIRIPRHPLTLQLLKQLDFPLAAPSANPFGYISPTTAQHVNDQLGKKIPYILDGGVCEIGIESTIIGFEDDKPVVYRLGGTRLEDIEESIGKVRLKLNLSSDPLAPGMLKSHYAPNRKVYIGKIVDLINKYPNRKIGIISLKDDYSHYPSIKQIILSPTGNLGEAAKNLFGALRKMDQEDIDIIITHRFPEEGLGKAINDRLHRASS